VSAGVDRENGLQHLAFSAEPEMCLGTPLARAETQEFLAALLTRLPDVALDAAAEQPNFLGLAFEQHPPRTLRSHRGS
jgi:cytochrome P450